MIKILNTRLLTLICFIMSVAFITACEKDDEGSDAVELLSFGPTGALHGDTLFIIGNNLDRVTAVELTGASVAKADFTKHNSEEIQFIIPASTQRGSITLVTPAGNIVSKTNLNLEVAPIVTSVTGEARPGANVTITGNYLNWVTAVTFADGKTVDSVDFVSSSMTQLVVTVPEDAKTGNLLLSYGGTKPLQVETEVPLTVTLPAATALAPNPVKHGANLTITGTNMDLVRQVKFTGEATGVATFVNQTATEVVVKVPQGATKGKLMLIVASGSSTETPELDLVLPKVTAMSPQPVLPEGELTITGTDLDLVKGIKFPAVADTVTTFISQTATQIKVKLPAGAAEGNIIKSMTNSVLTVQGPALDLVLPVVTALAPLPVDPEGELTITGTNLNLVTAIKFPEVTAPVTTFISKTATQIKVKVPAGAAKGKLTMTVMNSSLTVQTAQEISIVGAAAEIPFKAMVFGDGFDANWEAWGGWGTATQDFNNGEQVKSGSKAIKVVYASDNAYGAIQLHPKTTFPVPGAYSTIRLSIYGGNNATATSRIAVYLKDATDPTDAQKKVLTLVPGKYTTYEIPLSDFTNNPAKINELVIQNYGTAGMTIYIDEIGFY